MKDSTDIPSKILMTADTVGGVWTYALQLSKALKDIAVHLATMGAPLSKGQWREVRQLENVTVHESDFKLEWMQDPWKDITASGAWLLALEKKIEPDLVHLNNFAHGALPWASPVLMVAHSCVLSWWKAVKGTAAPAGWGVYKQKVTEGLLAADMVVSVSGYMQQTLKENYGELPRSAVIYNGRDRRQFWNGEKQACIFSMGRIWDEAKNLAILEGIADKIPWPILLAGEHSNPDTRNVADFQFVHLRGKCDPAEIASLLAHASIYVMPAKYEPFGLSVLEAALSGCCLVLGDIPSLRELWQDAAIFVHPDDEEQLKDELLKLIQDKALRQRLSKKALGRAATYSMESMAGQYMNAYKLLRKKNSQVKNTQLLLNGNHQGYL